MNNSIIKTNINQIKDDNIQEYEFELDNLYNHEVYICDFFMSSFHLDKKFINSFDELKHYYFKNFTKYCGFKKLENTYIAKYIVDNNAFNNQNFNDFFKKFKEMNYIFFDFDIDEKNYIFKDFPLKDYVIDNINIEYIDGKIYTVYDNDDEDNPSLRNIIKHMNEIIDITENNIVPYRLCQIYGYMNYDNNQHILELDKEGDEYLCNDKIIVNNSKFFNDNKGTIRYEHNTYFSIDEEGNLDEIELIPNKYGVLYGFNTYYELINELEWYLPMLLSPFEKIDFKTMKIDKLYEI